MKKMLLIAIIFTLLSCNRDTYSTRKFYDYDHNSDATEIVFKNSDIVKRVIYYSVNNELEFVLKTGSNSTFKHISRQEFKQFKKSGDIDRIYHQLKSYK